jgi:hypothetical protein
MIRKPQRAITATHLATATDAAFELVARVFLGARCGDGPLDERTVWTNPDIWATTTRMVNIQNHVKAGGNLSKSTTNAAVCSQTKTNNVYACRCVNFQPVPTASVKNRST